MKKLTWIHSGVIVVGALFAGAMFNSLLSDVHNAHSTAHGGEAAQESTNEASSLREEIDQIKGKLPGQAHAMMDVDYHFTNLWFAAKEENWPLADFYWKETVSHMRWSVRIIPIRKDSAGREVKLKDILDSIENSPFTQIGKTIEDKEVEKFETAYRHTMEGCYSCHKAAEKPYLRPRVPERPATTIINFDPQADWPK